MSHAPGTGVKLDTEPLRRYHAASGHVPHKDAGEKMNLHHVPAVDQALPFSLSHVISANHHYPVNSMWHEKPLQERLGSRKNGK